MTCPICQKRKAKRFCPAKGGSICSVCCGNEREVTIHCPSDCTYLIASREYDAERREREFDWSKLPFQEVKFPPSFARDHLPLITALAYAICAYARDNPSTVDTDVLASVQALAEAYRTLTRGIYYERPPDYALQRGLYNALESALSDFKKSDAAPSGLGPVRDRDLRDALILFAQLAARRSNGRPKGRAYLDFLRRQLNAEDLEKPASKIVLLD